jgi:CBS domain-containing membrane protein
MAFDVRRSRGWLGLYVLAATAITTAMLAVLAHYLREPFIFPSVGPTIFILFFTPLGIQAAPRNVLGGQLIGIACGYLSLVIFGLTDKPADIFDLDGARIGSAIVALSLTLSLMVWLGLPHAPAGATTLIVALGLVHTLPHLAILFLAVLLVVACAFGINRAAGIPVPRWRPSPSPDNVHHD